MWWCPGGEMADTADLKSADPSRSCRFESGPGHHVPLLHLPLVTPVWPETQCVKAAEQREQYTPPEGWVQPI